MTNEDLCRLAQSGDIGAESTLVETFLPILKSISKNEANKMAVINSSLCIEADDLFQEASIGLLKAIRTYVPEKGASFSTYANTVCRNAIRNYIRKSRSLLMPFNFLLSLGIEPLSEDSEEETMYFDWLFSVCVKTPEQIVIEKETYEEIRHALEMISSRECRYLKYRYGFDDDMQHNLGDTASHFHISIGRATKLERTALDNVFLELPWWYD